MLFALIHEHSRLSSCFPVSLKPHVYRDLAVTCGICPHPRDLVVVQMLPCSKKVMFECIKNEFLLCFVGIEARGFIFGSPIALAIRAKFVPLRKPKKFPEHILEYGRDCLEMHVVVDDLIATGGKLCAAMDLLGNHSIISLCISIIPLPAYKLFASK
ncbi:hypothetical protein JHK82_039460 [Glycine max]|uniref:adenine phosphoribosyltransferase n=2 Tax=Glycine subgen. Soja TaxID=1462606 RepID=I1M9D0_SOYBN|nr:hypothetical protein JHK87_039452 [Glycine soja]KAG4962775.1 hypothetical protein JHK86_039643 [Glycine max]KAG4965243.1 hypothetical protein JHK85_040218 [Glycine max]KAG5110237.1 hypothetical protein JHK82_039460 [Glycine max]KAG5121525.1 hypothetical protein JHK84_039865 [Glycine max]